MNGMTVPLSVWLLPALVASGGLLSAVPLPAEVRSTSNNDGAIYDIRSERGIGKAAIERKDNAWPKHVALRLHLKGLESLRITSGDTTLEIAVPSSPPHTPRVEVKRPGERDGKPVNRDSPLFPAVRITGAKEGKAKIPLEQGCFEVMLPAKVFEGNPRSIGIEWIDFYRN